MFVEFFKMVLSALRSAFRSRAVTFAENAVLRQQIIVLQRSVAKPRIRARDRIGLALEGNRVAVWTSGTGSEALWDHADIDRSEWSRPPRWPRSADTDEDRKVRVLGKQAEAFVQHLARVRID